MLKKKINFNKVRKVVIDDRLVKLRKEGLNIETGIINRTLKGKDIKNSSFKPYSKDYADYKQSKGKGKTVNLTNTGAMLQAISNKKIPNGIDSTLAHQQKQRKLHGIISLERSSELIRAK